MQMITYLSIMEVESKMKIIMESEDSIEVGKAITKSIMTSMRKR